MKADADPRVGTVRISTDNVERLSLALGDLLPQDEAKIQIDDIAISAPAESAVYLSKAEDGKWELTESPSLWSKGPHRSGPLKLGFDKRMVWVYGTSGSDEENAAILAKVRYDSQVWWYRGNGNAMIVPDSEFDPDQLAGRNIILYGNADTNSAFSHLLKDCPIQANRGEIRIGDKAHPGDLGALFIYPRLGSDENLIGVIGSTSVKATRMNFQAQYFISGVACPDYVLFGIETLSRGMTGVLEAGYFDNEWKLLR